MAKDTNDEKDDLKEFDFNKPITTTIIFDDSDNEEAIVKNKQHTNESKTSINTSSIRTCNKTEGTSFLQNILDMPLLKDFYLHKIKAPNNFVASAPKNYTSIIEKKSKYDKATGKMDNSNDVIINDETYHPETNQTYITTNNNTITNGNNKIASTLYNCNVKVNGNEMQSQIAVQDKEGIKNITCIKNDQSNTVTYLRSLLDIVSDNIINILRSYNTYLTACRNNFHPNVINQALYNYKQTKQHFFQISYDTVENIIIPRTNDSTFVKNFLNKTIEIDRGKTCTCTYAYVEPLYRELVMWTKERKTSLLNTQAKNNANYSELMHQLLKPVKPKQNQQDICPSQNVQQLKKTPTNHAVQYPETTVINAQPNPNKKCLFSCGPPGNEIRLDLINAMDYSQSAHMRADCCNLMNDCSRYLPSYDQHINQFTNHLNNSQQNQNLLSNTNAMKRVRISKKHRTEFYPQAYGINQHAHSDLNPSRMPQIQNQAPVTQPTQQEKFLASNYPDFHQRLDIPQDGNLQTSSTSIESNRSSISRDSGIFSPLNFFSDPTCNVQEEQRQQNTPLITHVTSLNPNASYIIQGYCYVCGKITKTKCLGCYHIYYCSRQCQNLDWSRHMAYCKKHKLF